MKISGSGVRELSPEELKRSCDPTEFDFETTGELPDLAEVIGQERAIRAVDFGVNIQTEGYNIYALGPTGTGRSTFIRSFLEQKAQEKGAPDDWCYVNNFTDPRKPRALRLPPGLGCQLREDMDELIRHLRSEVQRAFEGKDYMEQRDKLNKYLQQYREEEFKRLDQHARSKGFALVRGPAGFLIVPLIEGQPMTPEQFGQLDQATQEKLERDREQIQQELQRTVENVKRREKQAREELKALDQRVAAFAVEFLINDVKNRYSQFRAVVDYLSEVERDIINNVEMFRSPQGEQQPPVPLGMFQQERFFDRYRVNLIVDNSQTEHAPVVMEENPTYPNLVGRIEHRAEFGTLVTNFTMIKPGAFHLANGGYLIV